MHFCLAQSHNILGVCVLEMVIIPSFPLVVITAFLYGNYLMDLGLVQGNSHLLFTFCAPG